MLKTVIVSGICCLAIRTDLLPCFTDSDCGYSRDIIWTCNLTGNHVISEDIFNLPNFVPTKAALDRLGVLKIDRDVEGYDAYIERYLWALIRSHLSGEKIGQCEAEDASLKRNRFRTLDRFESQLPIKSPVVRPANYDWVVNVEPIDYTLPSILKKFTATSRAHFDKIPMSSGFVFRNLGEINCIPVTKLGRTHNTRVVAASDNELEHGLPVTGSFALQYRPLAKTKDTPYFDYSGSTNFVRYVAEPYDLTISQNRLQEMNASNENGLDYPQEYSLHRNTMKLLISGLSELVSLGELYKDKNDSIISLVKYVDAAALHHISMILDVIGKEDPLRIYMNFYEKQHGIDVYNGVLPLACDFVGDGLVDVEISALMLSPKLIEGLNYAFGITRSGNISIQQFLDSVKNSSFSQQSCSARIICME